MTVSFVLRLVVDRLARGEVAGEVQVVDSGETVVVRDYRELLSVLMEKGPGLRAPKEDK